MTSILVIVDVQNDYFEGGSNPLVGSDKALEKVKTLIDHFRSKHQKIFYIMHDGGINASFFRSGSEGIKIHSAINPGNADSVVIKTEVNAFNDTSLKEQLDLYNGRELVICGMMSHMCIDGTARAASDLGYDVSIIEDACATKDLTFKGKTIPAAEVHGSFMAALAAAYANVYTADEWIAKKLEAATA